MLEYTTVAVTSPQQNPRTSLVSTWYYKQGARSVVRSILVNLCVCFIFGSSLNELMRVKNGGLPRRDDLILSIMVNQHSPTNFNII